MIGLLMLANGVFFQTGNELLGMCQADQLACLAYSEGVSDNITTGSGKPYCLPSLVKGGQVKDVVMKYLSDNPKLGEFPASQLVEIALARAFPCPK